MRGRYSRMFGPDPRDVDDELDFHLEMRIQERMARGEDRETARRRALERLGDVAAARAACLTITQRRGRRMRRMDYIHELRQDLVYTVRALRRQPAFTLVVVLTLALGIGANSAIFSVVNGVLLEPLPYADPGALTLVRTEYRNGAAYPLSSADFMSVREDNRVFSDVGAYYAQTMTMTGRGEPRDVTATLVSRELFSVLGLTRAAGRAFAAEEHVPGAGQVAVLTADFAVREFGGVQEALDETLTLQGLPYTIVGVMPHGTERPERTEMYLPIAYDSTFNAAGDIDRRGEWLTVLGRRRPDASPTAVLADMRRIGTELQQRFPRTNETLTFTSMPLTQTIVGDVRTPLLVLLGAVGLVLLIACANVANLLLARATLREGELAVRAALGAGRGRIVRQLITESVMLAALGGALGLLLALWGTRALVAAQPADIPRLTRIDIDGSVIAFTAVLALLTGLLFGALPALQATGPRMMQALREGGRGGLSGLRGQRIRAALVVSELTLAVVLLVGAGLLIRSFLEMTRVDTGFRTENAVVFRISLQGSAYDDQARRREFFANLEERLSALPGVTHVGATSTLPMVGSAEIFGPFQVEGVEVPPNVLPEMRLITVTPEYFEVLGTPLLMGRMLERYDNVAAPDVALFNRAAIARWFPDGTPIGRRVLLGGNSFEVVGIVGDVLQKSPDMPVEPAMYLPYEQRSVRTMRYVVRGAVDMMPLAQRIRAAIHALEPTVPVQSIDPLSTVVAQAVARPRFYTTLLTLFASVAFLLALIGIFGVMSYIVAQRSREISIRMALGANAGAVVGMVVGSAMKVAAAGLVLGLGAALAGGRVLRSQLFGVNVVDPWTIGGVVLLLAAAAAVASFVPARRAARLEPGAVLRGG